LVWEKGGSGLNFHTDAAYWREQEGGFDERTTDEWDVDMQGYYGGRPGDYDAECRQDMDRMDRLRAGADESCFGPPSGTAPKYKRRRTTASPFIVPCSLSPDAARRRMLVDLRTDDEPIPATKTARRNARKRNIGAFERHTRGVGRQLLESLGWRDGEGLGRDRGGRANIIVAAHRKPTDKRGLGFRNAGPCWKATGEPVSSEGTEGQVESEVLERNQESVYKNIPIDVFSAYSREQKKIFQEDFSTFFRESCKGFEEEGDSITAVLHLDKSRREKLKRILASLKNNHGLPRIDLKPFVSGGTIGPGSGGIIDPVDVGTISPVDKDTKGSINGGTQDLCSEGNKTCDSEPSS
ncbi:G-patch domain, partial [Trinorchestia longiramus]